MAYRYRADEHRRTIIMPRVRYLNDDGDPVLQSGEVLKIPTMMIDGKTVDAVLRDEAIGDAAHRPGFRNSSPSAQAMVDAAYATRAAGRDARELAYRQYQQTLIQAWRGGDAISPEKLLQMATASATEAPFRAGRADPDDPRSKEWRKRQSVAEPFGHVRDPDDAGGEPDDGDLVCPHCGHSYHEPDDNNGDDAEVDRIVRETQVGVESVIRRDVPDSMYDAYDQEIASAWRRG
jgi:hypothetical protein